jgi:hypothetical protein
MVLSPQGRLVVFGGNDFGITKGLYEVNAALALPLALPLALTRPPPLPLTSTR